MRKSLFLLAALQCRLRRPLSFRALRARAAGAAPPGAAVPIEALRADFAAQSGGMSVYFARGERGSLTPQAQDTLRPRRCG